MVVNFHTEGSSSSSYHDNSTHPPLPAPLSQLKDTTSLSGSSNEVINDKPAAGGAANVIPKVLYSLIQKALCFRKNRETKIRCVDHEWDHEWEMNKLRNRPLIYNVGLKNNEHEMWSQFKELAESNCAHVMESSNVRIPVDIRHPFVILTGNFVVVGFNEAYQMYIKMGEFNRIRDPVLKDFKYGKGKTLGACKVGDQVCFVDGGYHIYMLIEAVEDGVRGIYRAEVRCLLNGWRTLLRFSLIDGTNVDESFRDAYLRMEFPRKEDALPYDSGMKLLKTAMGSVRYDYFNPEDEDF